MFPDFIEEAIIEALLFRQIFSRYTYDATHQHEGVLSLYLHPNPFSEQDDYKVDLYRDYNASGLHCNIAHILAVGDIDMSYLEQSHD